jgi:hypothetical protein
MKADEKKKIIIGIYRKKNDWFIFVTYWRGLKRRLKYITTKMAQSYIDENMFVCFSFRSFLVFK